MPELPEAEVILAQLRCNILNTTIKDFRIQRRDIVRIGFSTCPWYVGSRITAISRKGKSIVLTCSKATTTRYMVAQLGMTGLFLFQPSTFARARHFHIAITLGNGSVSTLFYWNPRRFGRVYLLDAAQLEQFLQRRFGVDPFDVSQEIFGLLLGKSRGRVKALLLNQHKIAGIGNIYANEILYRARIHPHAKGTSLSRASLARLYHSTRTVLMEAIASGGSTIRDFCAPDGSPGRFQEHHAVYQKTGIPCPRGCEGTIRRLRRERSSFFCQRCQKWT